MPWFHSSEQTVEIDCKNAVEIQMKMQYPIGPRILVAHVFVIESTQSVL